MFGNRRKYDTRSVTELSSGKYFAACLGLVNELRLGTEQNIHRCMLGLCPQAKSRVRVRVKG